MEFGELIKCLSSHLILELETHMAKSLEGKTDLLWRGKKASWYSQDTETLVDFWHSVILVKWVSYRDWELSTHTWPRSQGTRRRTWQKGKYCRPHYWHTPTIETAGQGHVWDTHSCCFTPHLQITPRNFSWSHLNQQHTGKEILGYQFTLAKLTHYTATTVSLKFQAEECNIQSKMRFLMSIPGETQRGDELVSLQKEWEDREI